MKRNSFVCLVLMALLVLTAAAPSGAETAAAPADADQEAVVARVGDKEIKLKDVNEVIGRLDPQRAVLYNNEIGRKAVAEELINMELLLLLGTELEVEKDPEFAVTLDALKKDVIRKMAIDRIMEAVEVTPEETAEFYEKNKDNFVVPEMAKASHILVDTEEDMEKVKKDLEAGMSFEEAAGKYSTCPSKEQGGDLGFFGRGQMVKEFDAAVFDMEPGEVTEEPVKTEYGLHLIKLVEKKESSLRPFEEVEDEISKGLENEKKSAAYRGELARLKEKHGAEILSDKKDEESDSKEEEGKNGEEASENK